MDLELLWRIAMSVAAGLVRGDPDGQPIGVKYLRENPDRKVIGDWVIVLRWPLVLLIFGVSGIVASRRI